MTDDPINPDGRRSVAGQRASEMRRRPANGPLPLTLPSNRTVKASSIRCSRSPRGRVRSNGKVTLHSRPLCDDAGGWRCTHSETHKARLWRHGTIEKTRGAEMTIKSAETDFGTIKATTDVAATRACLRCRSTFWSEGFGERICSGCKRATFWRPAIYEGSGQSRRRSGGRSS